MQNIFLLWKQILRNPKALGTVAPSSPFLARTAVNAAHIDTEKYVIEVGAGTGPITRHIIPNVTPNHFVIVEPNEEMLDNLKIEYPDVHHSSAYVSGLPKLVEELGWQKVDVVMSSLPWSLFSKEILQEGLEAIHSVLGPEGKVLTLVYSHAQYFPSSLYLEDQFSKYFENVYRTRTTWRNVPPGYFLVGERPKKR